MKTRHSTSPAAIILAAFCLLLAGDTASAITPPFDSGGVICSENVVSAAECDGASGPRAISDIPGGVRGKSDAATGTTLAHYAVFDASPDGAVRPVYHTYVWLASPPRSLSLPELQAAVSSPGRNAQRAAVTLETASGRAAFRTVVEIPRWVRGEFPGEAPGAEIDGHFFPLEHSYFVVRAPVSGDDGLFRIEAPGRVDASVSMRALAPVTEPAPRAAFVGSTAQGNPGNRVDLLIMGDGYTAGQGTLFETDAQNTANAFLDITPYAEYRNFVNVETLFTPSAQSGADHPPFSASCGPQDPSCCADPTATFDPLAGIYVDTAFDARYCYNNIHRLIDVDETAVFAAAAAVPDYDQILVLVNDTAPGGAGGQVMVASMQFQSVQVVQHEFGHSFTDLADEYDDPYPGYLPCSDLYGPPCETNVTDVTERDEVKWAPWINPATAVPTAESFVETDDQTVGLFEGARYLSSGMYRPGDWCLMRVLGQEFCPIAAQSYVLRLYNGSWGMPWEGIDIIEPGTEFPAPGNVFATEPVQFGVDLLQPVGGPPLEVQWYVDGLAEPGASSDGFLFNPPGPGTYTISLDVADPTELVHTAMAYGALRSSRSWTVVVTGDGIVGDANCDNEVDAVDALFALRYVAGMEPFAGCIGLANVKCDDGMTSVDALFILRYVVSLPVNLPPGCDPIGPPLAAFTVNSTLDPGNAFCDTTECTLREAINAANSHPGPDTIEFSIPPSDPGCDAGICTIVPTDYLPVLSDSTGGTTIDGYTQPGATPNSAPPGQPLNSILKIVIDGQDKPSLSGIGINSAGNVIRGLVLSRFKEGTGVQIFGPNARDNLIEGNFIGTDVTGTLDRGNCTFPYSCAGIWIDGGAHDNTIGPNNLIAFNNTQGIFVADADTTGNTITRNAIHSNDHDGIRLYLANLELAPPVITGVTPDSVSGTACAGCTVEVFSDNEDEGRIFEGFTVADGAGNWTLNVSAAGPNATATATDADGNTSGFASPVPVP